MPFDKQPFLNSELLELVPLEENYYHDLFSVAKDPLIWEQHPANDRWKGPVFKTFFSDALKSGGALIVKDKKTGNVIGSSRYHGYNAGKSEIEIGWTFLARQYWGGIYNGEMKRLMLSHAFKYVDSVIFLVGPQNMRSRRAVEKIGGKITGGRIDGNGTESLEFTIAKTDWLTKPQK